MSTTTAVRNGRTTNRTGSIARLDALLERSAGGDTAAFAALYNETASRAFGLSVRLLRDRNLAEDAVQEAYLTIWGTAASFDPRRGTSLAWILTIVHHTAVDQIRSTESRSARDDRHSREESVLRCGTSDPTQDLAHTSCDAHIVRATLRDLPGPQRQALVLAYFDGYTYREVAELLGIPLGTAKTRIRDALIRLRDSDAISAIQAARSAEFES